MKNSDKKNESKQADVECLHCGHSFKLANALHDELGWFTNCELCKSSFDVDMQDSND